jgi:TetR/AcrR family transcriptional regulator
MEDVVTYLPVGKQAPMTAKPTKSVRERLFRTALKHFADHGYAEVSVDEIVKSARTTKPMLYYYFDNKAGLYEAIAKECFANLRTGYGPASDVTRPALERLRAFVQADFKAMRENPDMGRFIYRTAYSAPRDAPVIDYWQLFMPTFGVVTGIIEAAQGEGLIAEGPPPLLALPLFGLVSIFTQVHLGGPLGNMLTDEQADTVVQFFLNGVGRR